MNPTYQKEPKVNQKELVEKFAKALANYRVEDVEPVLAEGEYNYFDIEGEEVEEGTREGYIVYLNRVCEPMRFTAAQPASIEFDQCLFCKMGNPVVLLNGGNCPYHSREISAQEKHGLMLEFKEDKISGVSFCVSFLKNENCYRFETNTPFGDRDLHRDPLSIEEIAKLLAVRRLTDMDGLNASEEDGCGSCNE